MLSFGAGMRGQLGLGGIEREIIPKVCQPLKNDGRTLLQIACGNTCTLMLTGRYVLPSLQQFCVECIQRTPHLLNGNDWNNSVVADTVRACLAQHGST